MPYHKSEGSAKRWLSNYEMFLGIITLAYVLPGFILGIYLWRLIPPENFRNGVIAIEVLLMLFGLIALHCFIKNRKAFFMKNRFCEEPSGNSSEQLMGRAGPIYINSSQTTDASLENSDLEKEITILKNTLRDVRDENAKISKSLMEKEKELLSVDGKLTEWMLKCQQVEEDRNKIKTLHEEKLRQKDLFLTECQQAMPEQNRISPSFPNGDALWEDELQLEAKNESLVKNLENENLSSPNLAWDNAGKKATVTSLLHIDLQDQLKKYIDTAVKIGHEGVLGGHGSKLLDFSFETFAVDLRRLYDQFRWETTDVIFIYSPQEERLLFINDEVRNLLGWSADKVIQNFHSFLVQGASYWHTLLSSLAYSEIRQLEIVLKTREEKNLHVQTALRVIPSGAYQDFVLGIFSLPKLDA
jgi:PAS domain-containing protein